MKLLFDQNLSFRLPGRLADLYPGSSQVRLLGAGRASDRAVWRLAKRHGLTIVTLDADFAGLSLQLGYPPKVIWLRCGNQPTSVIEAMLREAADAIGAFAAEATVGCLEIHRAATPRR